MSATALYNALIEAKVPEGVAEQAVDELDSAIETAAKAEFAKLQVAAEKPAAGVEKESGEFEKNILAGVDEKIGEFEKNIIAGVKRIVAAEFAKVRTEIVQSEVRSLRWQLAIAGVIIAAIGLFDKLP